jgi:hypothetical protein
MKAEKKPPPEVVEGAANAVPWRVTVADGNSSGPDSAAATT